MSYWGVRCEFDFIVEIIALHSRIQPDLDKFHRICKQISD